MLKAFVQVVGHAGIPGEKLVVGRSHRDVEMIIPIVVHAVTGGPGHGARISTTTHVVRATAAGKEPFRVVGLQDHTQQFGCFSVTDIEGDRGLIRRR